MTWEFFDFHQRYDEWVRMDSPSEGFRFWVMAWLARMQHDPETDAAPADGLGEPWWFAQIPHAEDDTSVVVCLYSIADNQVRCSGFSTLRKPIIN